MYTTKGKLVLVECKPKEALLFWNDIVGFSLYSIELSIRTSGKYIKPIIISETEEIKIGDEYYNVVLKVTESDTDEFTVNSIKELRKYLQVNNSDHLFKIITLPKQFSTQKLQDIANGILKDGDEIFIECQNK